jgi:Leucine-rich repeat (LRR) protein
MRSFPLISSHLSHLQRLRSVTRFTFSNDPDTLSCLSPSAGSLRVLVDRLPEQTVALDEIALAPLLSFSNLRALSLRDHGISHVRLEMICNGLCSSLESLNLSDNASLTNLTPLSVCTRLRVLDLSDCSVKGNDLLALTHLGHLVRRGEERRGEERRGEERRGEERRGEERREQRNLLSSAL